MKRELLFFNKSQNNLLYLIDLSVVLSIIYLIYLTFSFYDLNKIKISIDFFSLFIHLFMCGIAFSICFFIDKKYKIVAFYTVFLSIVSIHNVVIVDHYANAKKELFESKVSYSIFTFARSIYYYYVSSIILIYFRLNKFIYIKYLYLIFIFFSLIFVTFVFHNFINNENYFFIKKSIHYFSYFLKPLPYAIASFILIKDLKIKIHISNVLFLFFSILCFSSIILTMYYYKQLNFTFYHFTQINSIIFLLYIFYILINIILSNKKENENLRKEYIHNLRENIHDLKNEISSTFNKLDDIGKIKYDKIMSKIMCINKNASIEDEVRIIPVQTRKYLDSIIDDHYFNNENEKIEFILNTNEDSIYIDKNKTEIILNNLILNAIDQHKMFKINDPIKINIYIKEQSFLLFKNKILCIEIESTGLISKDISNHIYEKGFTTKDKFLPFNAGIGLYHARNIAIKLGGILNHISKNGRTKFILKLPQNN